MAPGNRSNLATRVLTAAIGIPVVLLIDRVGGVLFAAAVAVTAVIGVWEFGGMVRQGGRRILLFVAAPAAAATAGLPIFLNEPQAAWCGVIVAALFLTSLFYLFPPWYGSGFINGGLTLLAVLFVGLLLGHLSLLRSFHHGARWVLFALILTWAYDTGAYFAGSQLGRHPFMRHVSPKKTIEGVVGGVILSAAAGFVGCFALGLQPWQAPLLGAAAGLVAQIGDLTESMMKREVGVKDSGSIVPGHGGLLDRIDSLLFSCTFIAYAAMVMGYGS